MKKYILVGPYPPPLGGISVFIYRYAKSLEKEGYDVVIVDLSKEGWLNKKLKLFGWILTPSDVVFHLNGDDLAPMAALLLRPFGGRVVFQDHSGRFVTQLKGWKKLLFRFFLKKVDECRLVGEHLKSYYNDAGIKLPNNTFIKNAFIAPPFEDEVEIWPTYEPQVTEFIETRCPLIVANAFKVIFYNGCDLYGLDMCIELIARLKVDFPNVGLLFALAEVGENSYFYELISTINELGINENICFVTGQKQIWPIFKHADLMVRPTNTDGDAVSIREALLFGCPVVASDVCQRPEGTHVFKSRDSKSFVDIVKEVLK